MCVLSVCFICCKSKEKSYVMFAYSSTEDSLPKFLLFDFVKHDPTGTNVYLHQDNGTKYVHGDLSDHEFDRFPADSIVAINWLSQPDNAREWYICNVDTMSHYVVKSTYKALVLPDNKPTDVVDIIEEKTGKFYPCTAVNDTTLKMKVGDKIFSLIYYSEEESEGEVAATYSINGKRTY
jgi:hypothetical protein